MEFEYCWTCGTFTKGQKMLFGLNPCGQESDGKFAAGNTCASGSYSGPQRKQIKFKLDSPIKGPSGVSLTGYEWRHDLIEDVDSRGELVMRRVSNWEESEISDDTGRKVVHLFSINKNGKDVVVSLESALTEMGYLSKSDAKNVTELAAALKSKALLQMELGMETHEYKQSRLREKIEAMDNKIKQLNVMASDSDNTPEGRRGWAKRGGQALREMLRTADGQGKSYQNYMRLYVKPGDVLPDGSVLNYSDVRDIETDGTKRLRRLFKVMGTDGTGANTKKTPMAVDTTTFGKASSDRKIKNWYSNHFDKLKDAITDSEDWLEKYRHGYIKQAN